MKIVAAPSRHFKTYSMLLGLFIGGFNSIVALVEAFGTTDIISSKYVILINAILGFLIIPAKMIYQNISVTTEQKIDMVTAAAAQPIKDGNKDVVVKINKFTVPSKP